LSHLEDSLPPQIEQLEALILLGERSELTAADVERFEQILHDSPEARSIYARYMLETVALRDWAACAPSDACEPISNLMSDGNPACLDRVFEASVPLTTNVSLWSSTFSGTVGYLAAGWPVAYLVATVILGIGLAIAAVTHVSQPVQIVQETLRSPSGNGAGGEANWLPSPAGGRGAGGEGGPTADTVQSPIVGQVTGMVDCRFVANSKTEDPGQKSEIRNPKSETISKSSNLQISKSPVSLGDKFNLISGLLEITYDTGAKVILQGPVSYEVESPAGGFLSLGKLTARVQTTKTKDQRPKTKDQNPSSLIPHPLFIVRTPTATVTDLGTEFGVAVSETGATQVHVLHGVVETRGIGQHHGEREKRLTAGMAVEIGRKGKRMEAVTFAPQSFVQTLRKPADTPAETAYINAVLADKPMAYWPLNEPVGARKFFDRSGNGFHGRAMSEVVAGQTGPFAGKSRAVLLEGKGNIDVGRHDEFALVNDFTVEAWICMGRMPPQPYGKLIGANPDVGADVPRTLGWTLEASLTAQRDSASPFAEITFAIYGAKAYFFAIPREAMAADQWLHLAVVYDRDNTAHLYLNGKHRESIASDKPGNRGPVWVEIGGGPTFGEYWRGRLAHFAVYPRTLTGEQIQNHYNQKLESQRAIAK
jgi:hypothetical protein